MGLLNRVRGIFKKKGTEAEAKLHAIMALAYWNQANKEKKLDAYRLYVGESGLYVELGCQKENDR